MSILLAILVDAYMSNRQAASDTDLSGLILDISDILVHEAQKTIHYFWPRYSYISDEMIISVLSAHFRDSRNKKHIGEVHEHYHDVSLSNFAEIRCNFNIAINPSRMFLLLKQYFPNIVHSEQSVSPETAALLDPTVQSIMKRFGQNIAPPNPESKRMKAYRDFREAIWLDTMKRVAEMHIKATQPKEVKGKHLSSNGLVILHVTIEAAKNIPKMDMFRGADVFCVIFLEGSPELFQTEIRQGKCEKDWSWDPALSQGFKWMIPEQSELLRPEKNVVIMVYDKDQISEDDLIGCVMVQLSEVHNGLFNSWKKIIQPSVSPIKKYLPFPGQNSVPELKLQINMSTTIFQSQNSSSNRKKRTKRPFSWMDSQNHCNSAPAVVSSVQGDIVFMTNTQ